MSDTDRPFPLAGRTLVVGPSNVGKTRLTARALAAWVDREGTDGVVVLEFGPEFEHDGRVLGGRLSRFGELPEGVWEGVLDAHAPRAQGTTEAESVQLAADNAVGAAELLESVPSDPRAVFVNDATIPFQHERGAPEQLLAYCADAELTVLNAFENREFDPDNRVSRQERRALDALEKWADRVVRLDEEHRGAAGTGTQ